jgi:hypothetical protein
MALVKRVVLWLSAVVLVVAVCLLFGYAWSTPRYR